jgi:hypothetical protein
VALAGAEGERDLQNAVSVLSVQWGRVAVADVNDIKRLDTVSRRPLTAELSTRRRCLRSRRWVPSPDWAPSHADSSDALHGVLDAVASAERGRAIGLSSVLAEKG